MTLIETAVAVMLAGGALAMLGPALGRAREDAKLMTCKSNLGQINRALLSYRSDLGTFPIYALDGPSLAMWSYGGWSGRNREFWESYYDAFNIQTNERPLSVYMSPQPIPGEVDPFTPTQEMPLFKCPSDTISYEWQWGDVSLVPGLSAYNDVGTSYQINYAWWDQTDTDECPPGHDSYCWSYRAGVLGQNIYEKYLRRDAGGLYDLSGAAAENEQLIAPTPTPRWEYMGDFDQSRFITLMEDPCHYGLMIETGTAPGIQTMGYHGEFSKHVVAFADGGVEYLYMDTRHLHDAPPNPPGPRHDEHAPTGVWTACDQSLDHPSGGRHQ